MSSLLSNAILLSLFLFCVAMILTLIRLFKAHRPRTGSWPWITCTSWPC